jgi:hypothetical protein
MAGRGSAAAQAPRGSVPREVKAPAGKPPKWEKVKQGDLPPFWEPRSVGDSVEGPITQIRPNQFNGKTISIKDAKKGVISLRDHTQLVGLFDQIEPPVKKGDLVRVTYSGQVDGANGKYFTYELEFARTQVPF